MTAKKLAEQVTLIAEFMGITYLKCIQDGMSEADLPEIVVEQV